jgi:hypothetical protein
VQVNAGAASPDERSQGPGGGTSLSAIVPPMPRAGPPAAASSAPVIVTLAPRSSECGGIADGGDPKGSRHRARAAEGAAPGLLYEGELNGVWTPATRRAMKTFTDRVNATLPVDEPDAVLFAMVRSQQDRVCGTPCPADQGLSEDGRCLPSAILAKAARKPSPSALATYVPASGAPTAGKPLPARSGWSATVTAARPTPPAVGAPAAPTPPQALTIPAPATPPPTEGRMALAGPVDGPTAIAAADPRLAAKPTSQSGNTSRTRPSQRGPQFVSTPRPRSFVSTVFRRIDSRL